MLTPCHGFYQTTFKNSITHKNITTLKHEPQLKLFHVTADKNILKMQCLYVYIYNVNISANLFFHKNVGFLKSCEKVFSTQLTQNFELGY